MKVYTATFTKKDGSLRKMTFVRVKDLPVSFIMQNVKGTGKKRQFAGNMEMVWDLEIGGWRVFNWGTVVGEVETEERDDVLTENTKND